MVNSDTQVLGTSYIINKKVLNIIIMDNGVPFIGDS